MIPVKHWAAKAMVAGRQLYNQFLSARSHVRTRMHRGATLARPVGVVMLVVLVVSGPAVAPPNGSGDGSGIVNTAVCNSDMSTLLSAGYTLLTLGLGLIGVYRGGNGMQKIGSPNSTKKTEGRQMLVGAGLAITGAILVGLSPDLLSQVGLNVGQCVSFGGL